MKTGKITAKLRDAVVIRLFEDDKERKQYKNIELPDALKELEVKDCEFDVPKDEKITFKIHYAPDVLPQVFPAPRAKMTRAAKAAAKAASPAPSIVTRALAKDTKPKQNQQPLRHWRALPQKPPQPPKRPLRNKRGLRPGPAPAGFFRANFFLKRYA